METPLEIFSFSFPEKRSLHLRAIEKGPFATSILGFHKTITFRYVLILGSSLHLSSTPRGGLGTFWRRTCTAPSAFQPPRLLHGRAASYGSVIIWKYQEAELFGFQGAALSLVKAYQKFFRSGSDWLSRYRACLSRLDVQVGFL